MAQQHNQQTKYTGVYFKKFSPHQFFECEKRRGAQEWTKHRTRTTEQYHHDSFDGIQHIKYIGWFDVIMAMSDAVISRSRSALTELCIRNLALP